MLKIKLARFGKRNQPEYRIVVNEAKDKRDGKYVALLGHYAPTQTPKLLKIDVEAYKLWLTKGAQPTETVASLFKRFQSGKPFPPKKKQLSHKAKVKAGLAKEEEAKPKQEKEEANDVDTAETTTTSAKSEPTPPPTATETVATPVPETSAPAAAATE